MSKVKQSHCQRIQLHIDAYLDNELEPARVEELAGHVAHCQDCAGELAYAERLYQAVVSLPILDCSEQALEPIDRLFTAGGSPDSPTGENWRETLRRWIGASPLAMRVVVPVLAVLVLLVGLGRTVLLPGPAMEGGSQTPEIAAGQQYSQEEIVKALRDLQLAIDYLGEVSERTEVMIEDRFLLRQLEESINASFRSDAEPETNQPESNGPI
jgi:anti-sigma factor RsiW